MVYLKMDGFPLKGISFLRDFFSGSMLNFRGVSYNYPIDPITVDPNKPVPGGSSRPPGTDSLDLGDSAACAGESANVPGVTFQLFRYLHRALGLMADFEGGI